ncbi:MAG: hypothetical protein OEL66_02650 [Desulfobulbaceae bacterium]|nr:hypothetical protein [Desulfobulbaceae bacterium]
MDITPIIPQLWHGLGWPLLRLVLFISVGLMVGNFIEALNWTRGAARLAAPLVRVGNLSDTAGASFSMAFFSGIAANTMLAEAYDQGKLNKKELVLANLFNTLPTYFLHLPTVFFLTAPLIKGAAFIYVGLTLLAAVLRTICILILGRLLLTARATGNLADLLADRKRLTWREALAKAWKRFRKRIKKILIYTVPIYTLVFFMNHWGVFTWLEHLLTNHLTVLSWLDPRSFGIIVAHVAAEFSAGLAVAAALIQGGTLDYRQVVLALLVGNVLAAPARIFRHQFPYYAGIFTPKLAMEMIFYSQTFRVVSIILVGVGYYWVSA